MPTNYSRSISSATSRMGLLLSAWAVDPHEGLPLGQPVAAHEKALGPLHHLARRQSLLEAFLSNSRHSSNLATAISMAAASSESLTGFTR